MRIVQAAPSGSLTLPTLTPATPADQLDLTPVVLAWTTKTDLVGTPTYAWTASGPGGSFDDATSETPTYTPTAAGEHTLYPVVTDDNGAHNGDPVSFTVGTPQGFVVAQGDWREAVAITGDGNITVDGQTIAVVNYANRGTVFECTVSDGLHFDGSAADDPQVQLDLDAFLLSHGHTYDPSSHDYAIICHRKTAGNAGGTGVTWRLADDAVSSFKFIWGAGSSELWRQYDTLNDGTAGTCGKTVGILMSGATAWLLNGTVDPDTWDRDLADLTQVSQFGDAKIGPSVSDPDVPTGAATLTGSVRAAGDIMEWLMLDVMWRPRR